MENPISLNDVPTVPLDAHVSAPQFTCLSCLIGFPSGDDQRAHYRSDHHRYNMKRRVAGLPPVSATTFNQKVLDKRAETALTTSDRGATCDACNKAYSTENAYRSHLSSKRHKENEIRYAQEQAQNPTSEVTPGEVASAPEAYSNTTAPESSTSASLKTPLKSTNNDDAIMEDAEDDDDEEDQTLDERLAAARSRIGPLACLFCSSSSPTIAENLSHMAKAHSFFIPEAPYLSDTPGLITYLAEKLAIGNACLYCNREYRSLHAVRKHMVDKSHLKIAYEKERERMEISDFYDFSASYPDADAAGEARRSRTNAAGRKTISAARALADKDWEDADDDDDDKAEGGEDESVYDVESEDGSGMLSDEDDDLPANNLEYGDSPYELVLPSGARIGHRSMARYYKQSFAAPLPSKHSPSALLNADGTRSIKGPSGHDLVRRILAENSRDGVLVPASGGGFGAFGNGTMTIKARNRGEAKEAGRHVREHRDQRRREQFKTIVGFRNNAQKHFRDPLLQ